VGADQDELVKSKVIAKLVMFVYPLTAWPKHQRRTSCKFRMGLAYEGEV